MLFKAIVIGLIAIFCRLDSRVLGRLNFERPLITCTLVGLFLGDVTTGLAVGASMEMVSLGFMSIGASGFDMNLGSIVGCAIVIMTGVSVESALVIATTMTLLLTLLTTVCDVIRIWFTHKIDDYVEKGQYRKAKIVDIIWGPCLYSLHAFIPVFLAVYFGEDAINSIVAVVPDVILDGVSLGANLVSFFGFAMLLSVMINKKNAVFFFLGFIIAAYGGLSLTAISIISVVMALVFYTIRYQDRVPATEGGSGDVDELDD